MTTNVSMKRLGAIMGSVALVLLVVWYLALMKPQGNKLSAAHKADAAAKVKITGLHQQVLQLQSLEKEIPADKVKLGQYQQAIPKDPQLSKAIRDIQAAATDTGVSMGSLAPVVPTGTQPSANQPGAASGANTIPVTIAGTGSYTAITAFVQALSAMPRTLVVQSVAIGGTGNSMTVSISSDMYYTGS